MRRAWIVRFAWLLCLASIGTAVLPWAHDLSHRHGLPPMAAQVIHQTDVAETDSSTSETDSDVCIVCAHLFSLQLTLPPESKTSSSAEAPFKATEWFAERTFLKTPPWQRPAARAPPLHLSF